jgi:hypothetical protein
MLSVKTSLELLLCVSKKVILWILCSEISSSTKIRYIRVINHIMRP